MRENGEIYTAGKSFTLDRMVIFAKSLSKFIFFWETTFRVSSSGEWLSQEMAKSTFGLALSARLIDFPLHRQFVRQVKVYLCTMSYRQRMEKLKFCKIWGDPKTLSRVVGCAQNERQGSEIFITSLYIDVILQCNDILWERHALHYPRAYLLHLWGFCYLASLHNNLCAGLNRYTSSSNLIKCQRQNGS